MKIVGVVVNYRTAKLACRAVASLLTELEHYPGSRVVLVDNDSRDDSSKVFREFIESSGCSDQVDLIESPKNGGFGAGCNLGIKYCQNLPVMPEYIFFLNPDACLRSGALEKLVTFADATPQGGFFGSAICDSHGRMQSTCFSFPSIASEFAGGINWSVITRLFPGWSVCRPLPDHNVEVDWASGAGMLLRAAVLKDVEPFDESFFLYFEEVDLCHRASRLGWKSFYVRDSLIEHVNAASTGMNQVDKRMPTYWFHSRYLYLRKNRGRLYTWVANLAWVVGFSLRTVRMRVSLRKNPDRPYLLRDFIAYNFTPHKPSHS